MAICRFQFIEIEAVGKSPCLCLRRIDLLKDGLEAIECIRVRSDEESLHLFMPTQRLNCHGEISIGLCICLLKRWDQALERFFNLIMSRIMRFIDENLCRLRDELKRGV